MLKDFWNWDGEADVERYYGDCLRWTNKADALLCIKWDGATQGKTEAMGNLGDGSTYLLQPGLDFRVEPYADGRPAPKASE